MSRIDGVFAWDQHAAEASAAIKKDLTDKGTPIDENDAAIAGQAMAS